MGTDPGGAVPVSQQFSLFVSALDRELTMRCARVDTGVVYHWCMSRTNIDVDEEACRSVMERYHLLTKRDAVNFALRIVAAEPLDLEAFACLARLGLGRRSRGNASWARQVIMIDISVD